MCATNQDCSSLNSVSIPNSVTEIGDLAFSDCTSLTSVTLPNSLTTIGDGAFDGSGLLSVSIPSSVTRIEGKAFARCKLQSISCHAETPPTSENNEDMFDYQVLNSITLHVPDASVQAYRNDACWGNFRKIAGFGFVQKCEDRLKEFMAQLMEGEPIGSAMQNAVDDAKAHLGQCADDAEATQVLNETCKPALIRAYATEKKNLLAAAKKDESNDLLNEVYDECIAEIDAAVATNEVNAVKQAVTSGITAVTSARILHKYVE